MTRMLQQNHIINVNDPVLTTVNNNLTNLRGAFVILIRKENYTMLCKVVGAHNTLQFI